MLFSVVTCCRVLFDTLAFTDTAEVYYLHHQNIVHGDIKLQNVPVCGAAEDNFVFKTTPAI